MSDAREDILAELWEVATGTESPAAARVAALDKIAKIEGAYKPIVVESKNRFRSLADFYENMEPVEETKEAEE